MDYRDNFAEHPIYEPDFYTYDDLYYDFASSSPIVPTSNSSTVQSSSRGRNKPLHPSTVRISSHVTTSIVTVALLNLSFSFDSSLAFKTNELNVLLGFRGSKGVV